MILELLGALSHARRRHDDARRAVENALEKRAIQQPVLPLGADDLTVEVDDERPALPREEVGHERDRIRLVHHRQVGTEPAELHWQRRRQPDAANHREAACTRDRHAVLHLVTRGAAGAGHEDAAVHLAPLSLAEQLQHTLHAAGHRRVVLADVQDLHRSRARPPVSGASSPAATCA